MQEFFTQSIGYKPSSIECLTSIFLNEIYLETKQNFNTLLVIYDMIKIVFDESKN